MTREIGTQLFVNRNDEHGAFIVASVRDGRGPALAAAEVYRRLAEILEAEQLQIVQERVFGSLSVEAAVRAARRKAFDSHGVDGRRPFNYLPGSAMLGDTFAGLIVRALPAGQTVDGVQPVLDGGGVRRFMNRRMAARGSSWRTHDALHIILQDVRGLDPDGDNAPAVQAQRAIHRAQRLLHENGADYRHVVRTWFYLSDMLSWYKPFNAARTEAYEQFGLLSARREPLGRTTSPTEPMLPASTGIRADIGGGGGRIRGLMNGQMAGRFMNRRMAAACSLDLLAVVPLERRSPRCYRQMAAAASPVQFLCNARQKEAFLYGSAFSRCAVIAGQRERLIEVSGTAAIDEAGHSVCLGDVRAQVRCTLDKISFLLAQADCTLPDIQAATVFVKNPDDMEAVRDVMADAGLADLPAVYVIADVCRDELLFEIDAEAVVRPAQAGGT